MFKHSLNDGGVSAEERRSFIRQLTSSSPLAETHGDHVSPSDNTAPPPSLSVCLSVCPRLPSTNTGGQAHLKQSKLPPLPRTHGVVVVAGLLRRQCSSQADIRSDKQKTRHGLHTNHSSQAVRRDVTHHEVKRSMIPEEAETVWRSREPRSS